MPQYSPHAVKHSEKLFRSNLRMDSYKNTLSDSNKRVLVLHDDYGSPVIREWERGEVRYISKADILLEAWGRLFPFVPEVRRLDVVSGELLFKSWKTASKYLDLSSYDGIVLMGPRSAELAKIPYKTDKKRCFEQLYPVGMTKLKASITYDILTLNTWPNTAALLGHVIRALTIAATQKSFATISSEMGTPKVIKTIRQFDKFFEELCVQKTVSIDTETRSLQRIDNTLLLMQFAWGKTNEETCWELPWLHKDAEWSADDIEYMKDKLKAYFENRVGMPECLHVMTNAKFDVIQLRQALDLGHYHYSLWDIQAGEFLLDENRKMRSLVPMHEVSGYSLEQIAIEHGYFGYLEGDIGKDDRARMYEIPLEKILEYGMKDVVVPLRIYKAQLKRIRQRGEEYENIPNVCRVTFSAMLHAFALMEINGMPVDREYLWYEAGRNGVIRSILEKAKSEIESSKEAGKAATLLAKEQYGSSNGLFGKARVKFDIGKPRAQSALFCDVLNIGDETDERRKDGYVKLDKTFKKKYSKSYPLLAKFTDYTEAVKLNSTYIVGMIKKMSKDPDMSDGNIRPHFHYQKVITSRASASDPSLHQIPSRSTLSKHIKRQFIARPQLDEIFIEMDYRAHEVANWAIAAKDQNLASAVKEGARIRTKYRLLKSINNPRKWAARFKEADLHRQNCMRFFGTPPQEVTDNERSRVKAVVFGTLYDLHYKTLAANLGVDEKEALSIVETMFDAFPEGKEYLDQKHYEADEECLVITPIRQIRHLWMTCSADKNIRAKGHRKGPNSCIQGISSLEGMQGQRNVQDLAWRMFQKNGHDLWLKPMNSVHDSGYSLTKMHQLPISLYLIEHAFTTMVHKTYEDVYDFEWIAPIMIDIKVGGALSATQDWDFRGDSLEELVVNSIKWQRDVLGYKNDHEKRILRALRINTEAISNLRNSELRRMPESFVETNLLITPKFIKNNGLVLDA